jgi:hypothetical protein
MSNSVLKLDVLGIRITYNGVDKGCAKITSDMKEDDSPENDTFNRCVDAMESMILAHFCAGIDVSKAGYLLGITDAYLALRNNAEDDNEDELPEGKILLNRTRRVTASVDMDANYIVDKIEYEKLLEEEGKPEYALQELISTNKAERTSFRSEVDEVHAEHEVEVAEV